MEFYSPGKLLITGEYAVMHGAEAFAIPSIYGQHFIVKDLFQPNKVINWSAKDVSGDSWLEVTFSSSDLSIVACSHEPQAMALQKLLQMARSLNPAFLIESALQVETKLEFDRNWGLGSSSTLVANIAKWAEVDAFTLQQHTFGGSGYDVAVGMVGSELIYSVPPAWDSFVWNPGFKSKLYFIHLNNKQDSREELKRVENRAWQRQDLLRITEITRAVAECHALDDFQLLITEHEKIVGNYLGKPTVKDELFSDYPFAMKSLGAWGGDFILACGNDESSSYFAARGYETVLKYSEILR